MGVGTKAVIIVVILVVAVGFSLTSISAQNDFKIPSWIKNNALWWGQDQIPDSDFISAINYLIENKIISTSSSVSDGFFEKYKSWAKREITKYKDYSEKLQSNENNLQIKYEKLETKYENLDKAYAKLDSAYEKMSDAYSIISEDSDVQQKAIEEYLQEVGEYFETELSKPKTTIVDQEINWEVTDSKGNRYNWSMPIESYEDLVRATEPRDTLRLENTGTGEIFTVRDHTKFVRSGFTKVIDQVYDNAGSDSNFVYEVWYIVSQLTTYSYDIGEDPRWALETLSRGGGDCEDTAILIAEMINSSEHTKNWEINLVYFDAHNPNNPKTMNHVAVHIDDGKYNYLIESTAKDDPYAWPDGVQGWYFEI